MCLCCDQPAPAVACECPGPALLLKAFCWHAASATGLCELVKACENLEIVASKPIIPTESPMESKLILGVF